MNLLVCGDFEAFALEVDPGKTTASKLKQRTSKALDIPVSELTLYFNNSRMPDDTLLSQWKDMRSGAAVLVAAKSLKVTLQRYNSDIDVKFEISRSCVKQWTVETLFKYGLYKSGLPNRIDGKYVFMTKGKSIKDEDKSELCGWLVSNNCITLSVSFVTKVHCADNLVQDGNKRELYVPECTSTSCIEKTLTSQQKIILDESSHPIIHQPQPQDFPMRQQTHRDNKFPKWKLNIQNLGGAKVTVELNDHCLTSIHKLRLMLSSVETHNSHIVEEPCFDYEQNELKKIRLTFGTTILEDWDDEGNMMLLCSYSDLHDGATLCQINLTGAIIVNIPFSAPSYDFLSNVVVESKILSKILSKIEENVTLQAKSCILIENPHHFTVNRLIKIAHNCGISGRLCKTESARYQEDRYSHGWGHQQQMVKSI